jgi:hypothetical protein
LRKGGIAIPALELLKLVALRSGVESEAGIRRETTCGEVILATALGEGSTIAASADTRAGGEVAPASLTQRAEEARGASTFASGIGTTSHGDGTIALRHGGDTSLAAPVEP